MSVLMALLLTLLSAWVLLCGAVSMAARTASRARLLQTLRPRGAADRLDAFVAHRHEYALIALVGRQAGIVLWVILLMVQWPEDKSWLRHSIEVFLYSLLWVMVVGVSIPSALARYRGEGVLVAFHGPLDAIRRVGGPLLAAGRWVDELVRRLVGASPEDALAARQLEQAILEVVDQAESDGAVDPSEPEMIKSVMTLDETIVGQVMTPRTDIVGVELESDISEVRRIVLEAGHSRLPVYQETVDHVVGVLYAKDLLRVEDPGRFRLVDSMRPAAFVPETKDLASLLRQFQSTRVHIAIVLDEYGGTAGLVTIEDVLEHLVGDIADEHEEHEPPTIRRIDAQTADVDARARVEEVNEALELKLPLDESYDTVAGFLFSRLGRIPKSGESLVHDGARLEVASATDRSIVRVRVYRLDEGASR